MWTPIRLTDTATGRTISITIFERELYLSGIFSFEDLWSICAGREVVECE